jgi:hypothetical protein
MSRMREPVPSSGEPQESQESQGDRELDGKVTPLPGVMTGWANTCNERLAELGIPSAVSRVLRLIERRTFGNAGRSRREGREDAGLSCAYDRAEWARMLKLDGSNLRRSLRWLEDGLIIELTEDAPGSGRIRWRTELIADWHTPSNLGGRRPGAGAPAGNSNALKHGRYSSHTLNTEQASTVKVIDSAEAQASEHGQSDCFDSINLTGGTGPEAASIPAPEPLPRMVTKNREMIPNGIIPANTPPAGASAPPKARQRARKLTDEQLEAHKAEQGYCAELLTAMAQEMGYGKAEDLPAYGQAKDGAKWFYRHAQPDGSPAPVRTVLELYRVTKAAPFWRTKPLSLQYLSRAWPEWLKDPAAYTAELSDSRKQASRTWSKPQAPAAPAQPVTAKQSIWRK